MKRGKTAGRSSFRESITAQRVILGFVAAISSKAERKDGVCDVWRHICCAVHLHRIWQVPSLRVGACHGTARRRKYYSASTQLICCRNAQGVCLWERKKKMTMLEIYSSNCFSTCRGREGLSGLRRISLPSISCILRRAGGSRS